MDLIKFKHHKDISAEIRRELLSATSRSENGSAQMDCSF